MSVPKDKAIRFLTTVEGIGKKTAERLLARYGGLDEVLTAAAKQDNDLGIPKESMRSMVRNFNAFKEEMKQETVQEPASLDQGVTERKAAPKSLSEVEIAELESQGVNILRDGTIPTPTGPTTSAHLAALIPSKSSPFVVAMPNVLNVDPDDLARKGLPVQTVALIDESYRIGSESGVLRKGRSVVVSASTYKHLKRAGAVL